MTRLSLVCALVVAFFSFGGCMADEDVGQLGLPIGGWCTSSLDCGEGWGCSVETGDCLTPPGCRNQICTAVCYGHCEKLESCGDGFCPGGQVCCNDSCGICTPPDGFCTMQACEPTPAL